MILSFLGDSITEGLGASSSDTCYVANVAKLLNCTVLNYGVSGTRIARQQSYSSVRNDYDFNLRMQLIDRKSDKVFVFGGTNDYGHGDAPFGKLEDFTVHTFCGATNKLYSFLNENFGKEKVVIMLPLRRYADQEVKNAVTRKRLSEYVEVIKYFVKKYDFNYIDLWENGLPCPDTELPSKYFVDGLHPNDEGHLFIAEKVAEFIKRNK